MTGIMETARLVYCLGSREFGIQRGRKRSWMRFSFAENIFFKKVLTLH